jgi:hypothetical protein
MAFNCWAFDDVSYKALEHLAAGDLPSSIYVDI